MIVLRVYLAHQFFVLLVDSSVFISVLCVRLC